jgi:hypothetical protein
MVSMARFMDLWRGFFLVVFVVSIGPTKISQFLAINIPRLQESLSSHGP